LVLQQKKYLFKKKNKQQTIFYLPKNQINTIKYTPILFHYFYSKKIRFHHETIQSLLNFPVLFDGETQLPLRTQFVNETYIKCKNNYFLLIFFQKKNFSPQNIQKKIFPKCLFKLSTRNQNNIRVTSGESGKIKNEIYV